MMKLPENLFKAGWPVWRLRLITAGMTAAVLLLLWAAAAMIFRRTDTGAATAAEQVQKLSENIRRYYQNRPDFWGLSSQSVVDKKIAPLAMLQNGRLVSFYQTPVTVGSDAAGNMLMPGARSFAIAVHGLKRKECIDLAAFRQPESFWLGVGSMQIISGGKTAEFDWSQPENRLPVKKELAKKSCGGDSTVVWIFN